MTYYLYDKTLNFAYCKVIKNQLVVKDLAEYILGQGVNVINQYTFIVVTVDIKSLHSY